MKGSCRTFCTRLEIWKWIPKRQHYKKKKKVKKVNFSNLWKTKRCLSSLFTMAFHFNAEEMNLNCTFDRTTVGKTFYPFVSIENYMWENLIVHPKNNCLMELWGQGTQSEDPPSCILGKVTGWVSLRENTWLCVRMQYLICLFQLQLAAANVARMSASKENVKRGITRIWGRFLSLIIKNSFTARYMVQVFVILKTKLCKKVSMLHRKPH